MRSISDCSMGSSAGLLPLPLFQQRPLVTVWSSRAAVCRFSPGFVALPQFLNSSSSSCWTSRPRPHCPPSLQTPPTTLTTLTGSCRVLLSGEGHDARALQAHSTAVLAAITVQFVAHHHHSCLKCVEGPWRGREEPPPFVLGC